MNVIAWLIMGLIAGALARLLVPGRDSMGWLGTMVLGLVGSLVGGFIGNALVKGDQDFSTAGLLGSIVGAVVVLLIWRASHSGRRRTAL